MSVIVFDITRSLLTSFILMRGTLSIVQRQWFTNTLSFLLFFSFKVQDFSNIYGYWDKTNNNCHWKISSFIYFLLTLPNTEEARAIHLTSDKLPGTADSKNEDLLTFSTIASYNDGNVINRDYPALLSIYFHIYIYIYIYIYMCVCVCVCVCEQLKRKTNKIIQLTILTFKISWSVKSKWINENFYITIVLK